MAESVITKCYYWDPINFFRRNEVSIFTDLNAFSETVDGKTAVDFTISISVDGVFYFPGSSGSPQSSSSIKLFGSKIANGGVSRSSKS